MSRSLRRSYAVGAAAEAAMCPVSSMAFRFERAFRGAQKMLYRSPRHVGPVVQSSPSKAAGRSGALRYRGAVVAAQQSCVRLTREPTEHSCGYSARAKPPSGKI